MSALETEQDPFLMAGGFAGNELYIKQQQQQKK